MLPDLGFDDLPSGVIVVEDGGGIVSANVAVQELLGCDLAWLLGKPFSALLTRPSAILYHASIYMEVRVRGRVQETYLDLKTASGDAVPVLCGAQLRQQQGRTFIVLSATRMTERRRMEDDLLRTRRITEQIPGVVFQYVLKADGTHCIPYASEAMRQLFGVSPGSLQQSATGLLAALHPDDADGFVASVLQSAAELQPWRHQFRARRDGGPYRWREGHAAPDRLPDGATVWHGFMQDITERKAIEDALRDKEAADRANQAKSEFLARISHELRTPLNAILGFAQILDMDLAMPLAPLQRQRVQHIQDAGRDLLHLIDEVLDITGIEAGAMRLRPEWSCTTAAVASVMRLVEEPARRRGVQLRQHAGAAIRVFADSARLRQVLTNLLSNAVKYTSAGGTVTVSSTLRHDGVAIAVHDAGPGLTAQQLAHLFEPFNRLGAERTGVQGTGLGLVIVKRLVEAMGGTITVSSNSTDGTTFCVCMPHGPAAAAAQPAAGQAPALAAAAQPRGKTLRVLYVEDNPVNAIVMESLCEMQEGVVLQIAESGEAGLHWLRHNRADLLLLDMSLPDMDGLQLLQRIRALGAHGAAETIIVSADAMPEVVDKARQAGAHDYWTKPLNADRTLAKLRSLLQPAPTAQAVQHA